MAEKTKIEQYFEELRNGTFWNVAVAIKRTAKAPLDVNSIFESQTALNDYLANGVPYMGQPLALINADGSVSFYVLDANLQPQEVGKATKGDDKSIVLDDGVLKLFGFDTAETGAQLTKGANGEIKWVVPSSETVDGLKTTVEDLKSTVNGIPENAETGAAAVDGLVQKVDKNTKAIKDNKDAIDILNGDSSVEGSVAYQIAEIVGGADESFNTLKEIADWIAAHPTDAADYNRRITANEKAIEDLTELVGDKKVALQISEAIEAAIKVNGADKYALATELTALAGRVTTAETKIKAIEDSISVDPLHSHANKAELDKINTGDVSKWNTAASDIDTLKTEAAAKPLHSHTNKTVLDGITADKITAWDKAYTDAKTYVETYAATSAQGDLADTAVQSLTVLGKTLDKNTTAISVAEAKSALGLGSAAYEDTTAFDISGAAKAVQGNTTKTVEEVYNLAKDRVTADDVATAIENGKFATQKSLSDHIANSGDAKHVSGDDITKWNTAATLVGQLTGDESGSLGSITDTIAAAIKNHADEADGKYATITDQTAISNRVKALEDIGISTELTDLSDRIGVLEEYDHDAYIEADTTLKNDIEDTISDTASTLRDEIATAKSGAVDLAKAYTDEVKADILGEGISETFDTLKEIETWITGSGVDTTNLASAIAEEAKTRGEEDAKLDTKITNLETNVTTAYKAADATLKSEVEGTISSTASTLRSEIATAKSEAIAAAKTETTTQVNKLGEDVSANTEAIAANAELIATKANASDVYTKKDVDDAITAATTWGTF